MDLYPPGPTDWRQTAKALQTDPLGFRVALQHTYGNIVHYRHGTAHVYFVNEPELIRDILVQRSKIMARARITQASLSFFLGQGLLVSSGEYHHTQRKAMQPIFTPSWIGSYFETMQHCIEAVVDDWQDGQVRNIDQDMLRLSAEVIYRTVFGTRPSPAQAGVRAAIDTLQRYANQVMRGGAAISEATRQAAVEQLDVVVQNLIQSQQAGSSHSDFLSRLLAAQADGESRMSDQQIRDEVVTMLVAGHETTGHALTWLFYLLARHPDFQGSLRQKVGSATESEVAPVIDLAIQEALRLYPPVWLIGRSPTEPIDIGGYTVQPGATLVICPYVLHRTPAFFPDPDAFMPERFGSEPRPYTYLPFGSGPHVCIGQAFAMQELRLAVDYLLSRWQFELVETEPPEMEALITLRPRHSIQLRLHKV